MIYFSSDYHFNHNREFIYQARGFPNIEEMNEAIVQRHNEIVKPEDIIYVLGDLCLGGGSEEALQKNKELIERLNGTLYIIRGNQIMKGVNDATGIDLNSVLAGYIGGKMAEK